MNTFTEGQTVLHLEAGGRKTEPREVTVTKVGRTRVTVEIHGWAHQFHMDTGWACKDFGGRVVTPEQYAEEQRAAATRERLQKEYGLMFSGGHSQDIDADTWEKVLAVLDERRAVAAR